MKEIETIHAEGHVICHDITVIIKDEIKDTAFRKGHIYKPWSRPRLGLQLRTKGSGSLKLVENTGCCPCHTLATQPKRKV